MNDPLDVMGVVAARILRARRELDAARDARDAALVEIHKSGVCKAQVAPTVRKYLELHGFDQDALSRVGVSASSVRLVLDRPRSPSTPASERP